MIFSIDDATKTDWTALVDEKGEVFTYADLCMRVREFARCLPERKLVFLLCRNTPEAVCGYLGTLEAGSVPLLLNAEADPHLLSALFRIYRPGWIWMPLDRRKEDFPEDRSVFRLGGYELFRTGEESALLNPQLSLLLETSGSTGSPKLVRLSRRNIEVNAQSIATYLELGREDRSVTSLPMHYTYGLSVINSHLLAGGCLLTTSKSLFQREFWDFFEKQRATSLAGVPYTYQMLDRMNFCQRKPGSLRKLTQAGGKLPETLQRKFGVWSRENDVLFYVMYGQTEATARMSYLPPDRCLDKIGSIGIPIPGGKFWILDEAAHPGQEGGKRAAPGTAGELVYEGENVSLGYAQNSEDLKKGDERKGVLHTGDLARCDSEGFYYIIGRKSRFLKLYGNRVSLDACEDLLSERFPDCEIACRGTDDNLCIYVTDPEYAEDCCSYLADVLHISRKAFRSYCVDEMPKNDAGKIQYFRLQELEAGRERRGESDG